MYKYTSIGLVCKLHEHSNTVSLQNANLCPTNIGQIREEGEPLERTRSIIASVADNGFVGERFRLTFGVTSCC
jgi:hypothetical protein